MQIYLQNATDLNQPMGQGVITSFKKKYRTELLTKRTEDGNDFKTVFKDYMNLENFYDVNSASRVNSEINIIEVLEVDFAKF